MGDARRAVHLKEAYNTPMHMCQMLQGQYK
jgi:hypothetical protein